MREFRVAMLLGLVAALEVLGERREDEEDTDISEKSQERFKDTWPIYVDACRNAELTASHVSLRKIMKKGIEKGAKWKDITDHCKELKGRLIDETGERVFFGLNSRESDFFRKPRVNWEAAIARFPSVVEDIEEASKCYALSRYAASVFHSTQVVEAGLIELGVFLKVNDPKSGWTAVSKSLNAVVQKPHGARTKFERKNFAFLEQMQGTVEGLKNAWRNKISHVQGRLVLMSADFSPEIAEEILLATRAFIRRLAEGLPASKKRGV